MIDNKYNDYYIIILTLALVLSFTLTVIIDRISN